MVPLSKVARALTGPLQLLPVKRHEHVWYFDACHPPACGLCGATLRPSLRDRLRGWVRDLADAVNIESDGD